MPGRGTSRGSPRRPSRRGAPPAAGSRGRGPAGTCPPAQLVGYCETCHYNTRYVHEFMLAVNHHYVRSIILSSWLDPRLQGKALQPGKVLERETCECIIIRSKPPPSNSSPGYFV